MTTKNAGVVSRLPSAMAVWELPMVDLFGDTIDDADDFDLGDILRPFVWSDTTTAPADVCVAVGFSSGAVNATNVGTCVMLQATAGGRWLVHHGVNTGAGWAYTAAAADNALTKGGSLQTVVGTAVSQARVNAFGLDATGEIITTATSQTSPSQSASQSNYDRMFVGVGWATGSGGTPATRDFGVTALLLRLQEVPEIVPF